MSKMRVAAIQINSNNVKKENLEKADLLIGEAARCGAKYVALPEFFNFIGPIEEEMINSELIPEGMSTKFLSETAKKNGIWLNCGSILEKEEGNEKKHYNTSMIFNPDGNLVYKYRKLHLFDLDVNGIFSFSESDMTMAGKEIVIAKTDVGNIGMALCYDVRFPELFRIMALEGAEILTIPASFTLQTGKDHWKVLLRTRAIENLAYVIAPAQYGVKLKYTAYGRSKIIDPWGNVIASAPDMECVIFADIDLDYVKKMRKEMPVLSNRRSDVYTLKRI